jgi:putative hydrolase of the HAD superfamily
VIVVFDLDDTLYPEETFVRSGFRAVAEALGERFGVAPDDAVAVMWRSLQQRGRGQQFDDVVEFFGLTGRQSVAELVRIYRHHSPSISLPRESQAALDQLQPRPLYVVTDGHKVVQQNKLDALGIGPYVRHAYLTHRYGIHNRKPSVHVFQLLMRRERCAAQDIVYIGDDPSKDFLGLRPLGFHTLRVLTGRHASLVVPPAQDAERTIGGLAEVPQAVIDLETRTARATSVR